MKLFPMSLYPQNPTPIVHSSPFSQMASSGENLSLSNLFDPSPYLSCFLHLPRRILAAKKTLPSKRRQQEEEGESIGRFPCRFGFWGFMFPLLEIQGLQGLTTRFFFYSSFLQNPNSEAEAAATIAETADSPMNLIFPAQARLIPAHRKPSSTPESKYWSSFKTTKDPSSLIHPITAIDSSPHKLLLFGFEYFPRGAK